jgi:hypothetical protein
MTFEIVPKALGQELREELNYIERLAVVDAAFLKACGVVV